MERKYVSVNTNNTKIRSDLVQGISYAGRPMTLYRRDAFKRFRLHDNNIFI